MWNANAFSIPESCSFEGSYTLAKKIPALQIVVAPDGCARAGSVMQLPQGAQIQVYGEGFNERTVKVRWEESYFFVFVQDLDVSRSSAPEPVQSRRMAAGA